VAIYVEEESHKSVTELSGESANVKMEDLKTLRRGLRLRKLKVPQDFIGLTSQT